MSTSTSSSSSSTTTPSSSTTPLTTSNSSTSPPPPPPPPPSSSSSSSSSPPQAHSEARSAVLASLSSAGSTHDQKFQSLIQDIHSNSTSIAKQEACLEKNVQLLAKESTKWHKELDKATKSVNDIGDVQNWAEMMERGFLVLEETLRLVDHDHGDGDDGDDGVAERVTSASGGSTWRLS